MNKFVLLHAYRDEVQVQVMPDRNIAAGYAYFLSEFDAKNIVQIMEDRMAYEKRMNDWIRKYDNLLHGLNYWKQRALNSK